MRLVTQLAARARSPQLKSDALLVAASADRWDKMAAYGCLLEYGVWSSISLVEDGL